MTSNLLLSGTAIGAVEVVHQLPDGNTTIELIKIITQLAIAIATIFHLKKSNNKTD